MKTLHLALATSVALSLSAHAGSYTQDFTGIADGVTDLGDGTSTVNANTVVQVVGEQLRLTENTNSNNAAFHIPAIADSSKGFTATFKVTISDPAGGNPPADGIAFSYGPIPTTSLSALPEEGWPGVSNVLSFEIDTWDGGSDWGPAIGLDRPADINAVGLSNHTSTSLTPTGKSSRTGRPRPPMSPSRGTPGSVSISPLPGSIPMPTSSTSRSKATPGTTATPFRSPAAPVAPMRRC